MTDTSWETLSRLVGQIYRGVWWVGPPPGFIVWSPGTLVGKFQHHQTLANFSVGMLPLATRAPGLLPADCQRLTPGPCGWTRHQWQQLWKSVKNYLYVYTRIKTCVILYFLPNWWTLMTAADVLHFKSINSAIATKSWTSWSVAIWFMSVYPVS